jgi:uncharacterized protein YegP (UPF0339 family)
MKKKYSGLIKIAIFYAILMFTCELSMATTYYVSNSGNDSNTGLTATLAWKTIAKVNSVTYNAGDQILFQKGGTFYGGLTVNQSGIAGSPITYGAYGTGANPVISGFTAVTAWTNLGSNIWESTNAVSSLATCNVVVINGELTPMGRYPNLGASNTGYLRITSSTATSITNPALTGTPNWTGATAVIRLHNTRLERIPIASQTGSTINFATSNTFFTNWGFFIQNSPLTLDAQNEWYYNPTTKKIRVYSISQPADVKVASVTKLANLGSVNYIAFENIAFEGANEYGIQHWVGSDATRHGYSVKNCSIYFVGINAALFTSAQDINFEGNTVYYCNGIALKLEGNANTVIRNNDFRHNGTIRGADTDGGAYGAISFQGTHNHLVEGNTIIDTGNNGITFHGDSVMIRNNYIDTFNQIMDDGAGITGGGRFTSKLIDTGNTITENVILNGIGAKAGTSAAEGTLGGQSNGIYTADNISYLTVSNNTIYNCAFNGLFIKWIDYVNVTGNTVYNCGTVMSLQDFAANQNHKTISNNKFIAKSANQLVANYRNDYESVFTSISVADNNYYCRPILENNKTIDMKGYKSLSQWQAYSGLEANSKISPVTVTSENDLQFEYNASKTVKTVSLSRPMIDVAGTKYGSSVNLQPYTSVVLLKDPNPEQTTTTTVPVIPAATVALAIPGTVQAEDYSAYNNLESTAMRVSTADGGTKMGYNDPGDWYDYSVNVASAGNYTVDFRVANGQTIAGQFQLLKGTSVLSTIDVAPTGGWDNFVTISKSVTLAAGTQTLRILTVVAKLDYNWYNFTQTVAPSLSNIAITPASSTTTAGTNVTFAAQGKDQFGANITAPINWSVSAGATISTAGVFSSTTAGTYTVTATSGTVKGTASVTVNPCAETSLTAYAQLNGGLWQQTSASTITAGGSIILGPLPVSGGTWSWTGPNGFTANSREIALNSIQTTQAGNYVSSFTNSCGTKSSITNTINVNSAATLFLAIPGKVEAESYAAYNNIESTVMRVSTADGGTKMGYNDAGDWYDYSVNVASAGTYTVDFRVANGQTIAGQFQLLKGTSVLSTIDVAPTGGWDNFVTISKSVTLAAGTQTLRILTVVAKLDYNWYNFTQAVASVLTTIAITPATSTTTAGTNVTFAAQGKDQFGANITSPITWTVSAGATISAAGVFSSTTAGTYTVTATSGTVTKTAQIAVTAGALSTITLIPATAAIASGATQQYSVAGKDAYNNVVPVIPNWTVSGGGAISTAGLYTATISGGPFTVKATSGAVAGTASVTVNPCAETSLTAYAQLNGGLWQQTSASTITAGGSIILGPLPVSGGTWSWTGPNGFTANSREIALNSIQTTQAGNYVSSFTNSCGTKSSITNTINVNSAATLFLAIPGKVEAESYAAYNNIESTVMRVSTADGGTKMGYNDAGDWYDYSVNVASAGTYTVDFRVANGQTIAGQFQLLKGTSVLSTIDVAPTGGWDNFVTISKSVTLAAGTQTLRILTVVAKLDYNWYNFTQAVAPPLTNIAINPATSTSTSGTATGTTSVTVNPCAETALTAYAQLNEGLWQQTTASTITEGGSIKLGPQPTSGGAWSWTGPNGFTSNSREIYLNNIQITQSGNYISSFTNSCGTKSSITNIITVNSAVNLAENSVVFNPPMVVESGDTYVIPVTYSSITANEVQVALFSNTLGWVVGQLQQVAAGSGVLNFTITVPAATAVGNTYIWQTEIRPVSGTTQQRYKLAENINVQVTNLKKGTLGFDALAGDDVSVYPSPVSSMLNVNGVARFTKIAIYNSTGQLVKIYQKSNEDLYRIDVQELKNGIYLVEMRNETERISKKIIKN